MPDSSPLNPADRAPVAQTGVDLAACAALMRGGSKSFFAASLLLPARVRRHATALYAFCRVADDVVDLHGRDVDAVALLHERLRHVYAGTPLGHTEDRALAGVVARFGIPRALLTALIEGFQWDALGRRYETLDDLHDYAARVAGTVGAMMAILMETRSAAALARACELGVAMQLTNIARDVGEDARAGRLYLPRQWLREAGLDPDAWLAAPVFNEALASVIARLLAAADELYARAEHGIAALPRGCRPAIQAARLVYAEIGRELARSRFDSVSRRSVVSARRKAFLMARAVAALVRAPARPRPLLPLPAIRFLVDAAQPGAEELAEAVRGERRSFRERTIRIIELMEEVAHRQRERGGADRIDGDAAVAPHERVSARAASATAA
jgi:phytoene synthase